MPVYLNNIFDSGSPATHIAGIAGFQGVHPDDLTVQDRLFSDGSTQPIGLPFNAWEVGRVNTGAAAALNWQVPAVRNAGVVGAPRVDISPFTTPNARGTLYVNDLFRNSPEGDITPHDFRLAPNVTEDPESAPSALNPLVNQGLWMYDTPSPAVIDIVMANGVTLTRKPGLPANAEDLATFHAWDEDAEGLANPRVVTRPGFASSPDYDDIDLGADEMDRLIMAGSIDGTRIYSEDVPNTTIPDHGRVFFVDLKVPGTYPRPEFNALLGEGFTWWAHVQGRPDGFTSGTYLSNFTAGVPSSGRWAFVATSLWMPFMRSLACDISPHLLFDLHPYWANAFTVALPSVADIYATNAWGLTPGGMPPSGFFDNYTLYYNPPTMGYSPHATQWQASPFLLPDSSFMVVGLPNPPGTVRPLSPATSWLTPTTFAFGPFAPCTASPASTYTIGTWGYNDLPATCPDRVPWVIGFAGHGIRFNCEVDPDGANQSNLQTWLGVSDVDPNGRSESRSRAAFPRQPSATETAELHRRMIEIWRRR